MNDVKLLQFINDKLVNVYNEHPNTDYLIELRQLSDDLNLKIKFLETQNIELGSENQFLNDEYQQFIEMLPKDATYLDLPDGGNVHPSEQMRRMIADKNKQIQDLKLELEDASAELDERELKDGKLIGSLTNALNNYENRVLKLIGNDTAAQILFRSERLIGEQMNSIDKLNETIDELKSERDYLLATVKAFTKVISERFTCKESQPDGTVITDGADWALKLLATTPQQHLRDVQAEAVIDAIKKSVVVVCFDVPCVSVNALRNYAESVKAGEK